MNTNSHIANIIRECDYYGDEIEMSNYYKKWMDRRDINCNKLRKIRNIGHPLRRSGRYHIMSEKTYKPLIEPFPEEKYCTILYSNKNMTCNHRECARSGECLYNNNNSTIYDRQIINARCHNNRNGEPDEQTNKWCSIVNPLMKIVMCCVILYLIYYVARLWNAEKIDLIMSELSPMKGGFDDIFTPY